MIQFPSLSRPAGAPSAVDDISAIPNSQSSIFVSWLCPLTLNVQDHALLRYRLFYQEGSDQVDTITAASRDGLLPTLQDGMESENCLVEYILQGIDIGTTYAVKVVAMAPENVMGEVAGDFAVSTTFGSGECPL